MTTLHASVWLLLKEKAAPDLILQKYVSIYGEEGREEYLWILLFLSVQASHCDMVRILLDLKSLNDKLELRTRNILLNRTQLATGLNEVVRKNDVTVAEIFLELCPYLVTQEGNYFVTSRGPQFRFLYTPIELSIIFDNVELLQLLMKCYDGEILGDNRYPLHFACQYSAPKCLEYLLSEKHCPSHIDHKDGEGWTPLLLAAAYQPLVVPTLISHGANVLVTHNNENTLHKLCNGCIVLQEAVGQDSDPIPTIGIDRRRRSRTMIMSDDKLYMAPNIVELAQILCDKGLNVNDEIPPLRIFCQNIRSKLQELLGDSTVSKLFTDAIAYLASVSDQAIRDKSLLDLCHQMFFIVTQLRRSSDYDNITRYTDLLEVTTDCITILLENGSNPNITEEAEHGEKRVRAMQFLVPNTPCAAQLKQVIAAECNDTSSFASSTNTPLDIILVLPLILYPIQIEEPEMHQRALKTITDAFVSLSRQGGKCTQIVHFFITLSVDPVKHGKLLEAYLDAQSQSEYHNLLEKLISLGQRNQVFAEATKEFYSFLGCLFSLKDLLRRDIIRYIGSQKCPQKVDTLPIPTQLKHYIMAFWE